MRKLAKRSWSSTPSCTQSKPNTRRPPFSTIVWVEWLGESKDSIYFASSCLNGMFIRDEIAWKLYQSYSVSECGACTSAWARCRLFCGCSSKRKKKTGKRLIIFILPSFTISLFVQVASLLMPCESKQNLNVWDWRCRLVFHSRRLSAAALLSTLQLLLMLLLPTS